ncbi:MAG: hypothetical protein ACI808_001775 [Paraglaciecola sp.]
MALKPTIYKFKISLSDLNRDYYDQLNLTVAQHPSETNERMMTRVLAYCINAQEHLSFTKGLSAIEEPDIWARGLDDQLLLWIDVGEPAFDRIKKATRIAKQTRVYTFNAKSDMWWRQSQGQLQNLDASVFQFQWAQIQALAGLLERTVDMSITITGDSAYVAAGLGEVEVSWETLQER